MPLDDRLRTGLPRIADEVDPDVERGLHRVTSARPPSPVRRASTLLAYASAVGLGIVIVLGGPAVVDRIGTSGSPGSSPSGSPPAYACDRTHAISKICAGPVEPGAHRSGLFMPPIDYIVPFDSPVAWDSPNDQPGTFTLHPAGPDTDGIFFFRNVRMLTPGCDPQIDETVGSTAGEIADWFDGNPGLITTNVQPVALGGLRGELLDIAVSGTYTTVCPSDLLTYPEGLPIVPLFASAGSGDLDVGDRGGWWVGGSERIRFYLLDMPGGGNLVIGVDAIHSDFEQLLQVCQPVIESITFDSDYY